MVQTPGELILRRGVWETSAIVFKLIYQKLAQRTGGRIDRQNIGQDSRTGSGGQRWLSCKAWNRCCALRCQTVNDRSLIIEFDLRSGEVDRPWAIRTKLICAEQQRDGILSVLAVAFEREEHEGLVLDPGKAKCQTILLAAQSVLGRSRKAVGQRRIESLARLPRLAESERIPRIESIVAEETIEAAMDIVGPSLGNDIDRRAGRAAEISAVVAAVDLEFLHRILA